MKSNPALVPVPKITQNSYCTLLWRAKRVEREPGVWGQSPQRGPGAEPLVRGAKPPEAENLLKYWTSNKMGK